MKKRLIILLIISICTMCAGGMAQAALDEILSVGEWSESAESVVFVNESDMEIRALWLLSSDGKQEELLKGRVIPVDGRFRIWFEGKRDHEQAFYDLMLGFADGERMTLHQVEPGRLKEAAIRRDVNVAFLVYTDPQTGKETSTWIAELRRLEQAEAVDIPVIEYRTKGTTEDRDRES